MKSLFLKKLNYLTNKNILLAVTGGIAAYKSAEIVRKLKKEGSNVRVVMTKSSQEFITPLTLQALSGNPVKIELLDPKSEEAMGHIELSRWADVMLIAPCTANTVAKLASGEGDDLLSTVTLAYEGTLILAPAMNQVMWRDARTQKNIKKLKKEGTIICGPASGEQACGEVGHGRMVEHEEILKNLSLIFDTEKLSGKKVLITAGPTQEPIDPVRYISNRSSGKMGFSLAEAALEAGAKVVLISGPVSLDCPKNVHLVKIKTAEEMLKSVMHHVKDSDIFISTAAVADYRPKFPKESKIKKLRTKKSISLEMNETTDILREVSNLKEKPFVVGFAAETDNLLKNSQEKLRKKKLDLVVGNDVSSEEIGFDSDYNEVLLITNEEEIFVKKCSKTMLSRKIIKFISNKLK